MFGRGTVKVADHVAMNAAGVEALNAAIGDAKIPQAVFETQDAAVEVLTNVLNGLEASVNRDDATQAIIAGWRWIRANTKGDGDKLFDKKKEACIADLREQAEKSAIIIAKPKLVQGIRDGRSGWSQGT